MEPSVFCFALWRPPDLFKKLVEYWLTVKGNIGWDVFLSVFFYPLLLLYCWESRSRLSSKDDVMIWARDCIMIVFMQVFLGFLMLETGISTRAHTHILTVELRWQWHTCVNLIELLVHIGSSAIDFHPDRHQWSRSALISEVMLPNPTQNGNKTKVAATPLPSFKLETQINSWRQLGRLTFISFVTSSTKVQLQVHDLFGCFALWLLMVLWQNTSFAHMVLPQIHSQPVIVFAVKQWH